MYMLTPHTRGAGYFANNIGTSKKQEADILTCKHCERVIKLQEWKHNPTYCIPGRHIICGQCERQSDGCTPMIKRIEKAFDSTVKLAQFRKLAGLDAPPADYQPAIIVGVP